MEKYAEKITDEMTREESNKITKRFTDILKSVQQLCSCDNCWCNNEFADYYHPNRIEEKVRIIKEVCKRMDIEGREKQFCRSIKTLDNRETRILKTVHGDYFPFCLNPHTLTEAIWRWIY